MRFNRLKRRELITLLGGAAAVAWPPVARAQQRDRVRRIGVLTTQPESDQETRAWVTAFVTRLFVINMKTAKALGLDVPPMLLSRADEVIE